MPLTKHVEGSDWYGIRFDDFTLADGENASSHIIQVVEHEVSRRGGAIDKTAAFVEDSQLDWPLLRYKLKPEVPATQIPGIYHVKGIVTTSADRKFIGRDILLVHAEGVTVAP